MTIKQERAAQLIQEILGELFMMEVTDPALQDVTITDVKVDREIEYAQIYVHALEDREAVMAGLERASGFLRRELAARTGFRKTPALLFHWDVAIDHGERIDELLSSLDIPASPAPAVAEEDSADDADDDRLG
ncbi:MAG: 30S ribosome-binding factor RbfA [Anaerolineae bacterium]|nr:30S ribosome-binding factor RbfA [Anaerolineae bacterium]